MILKRIVGRWQDPREESCWIESLNRYRKDPTTDDRSYCFGGAGFAGWLWVGADFSFCSTDAGPLLRVPITESVMDVTMKMMAHQVVALVNTVAAPRGPKAVWLPIPPKAAAMSPLLPLSSRTTVMRNKQTTTRTTVISALI